MNNNNITIKNITPQEITISGTTGAVTGVVKVFVNGVDVTEGNYAYVEVPTKLSELTNDEGFLTSETDPTVPSYVKDITLSDINNWNNKQDQLVSTQNIKTINNESLLGSGNIDVATEYTAGTGIDITDNVITNTITSYNDLTDRPVLITSTSQLVNDSGFITNTVDDLENYLPTTVLESILPHSSDSGTGPLYLENSAHYKLNIELNPSKAEQHTTTGKNILPFTNQNFTFKDLNYYVSEGNLYITGTSSGETISTSQIFKDNFSFSLEAGTYTLQDLGLTSGNRQISKYSDNTMIARVSPASKTTTFTLEETTQVFLGFYVYEQTYNNELIKLQLEKGSSATAYEEYTGGMPSPNPLYPQDIYTVNGENTITICGRNMYEGSQDFSGTWNDESSWTTDSSTYNGLVVKKKANAWNGLSKDIYVESGKTYTFSAYIKSDESRQVAIYTSGGTSGIAIGSNIDSTTEWVRYSYTFTAIASGTIRLRVENRTTILNSYTYVCGYQLENGSTLTPYQPYESQVYPINLEPLDLLSIDTEWGKYENFIFKNSIDSPWFTYDVPAGVLAYGNRVYKYTFNSNDNWEDAGNGTFYLELPANVYFGSTKHFAISTHFLDRSLVNDDNTDSWVQTVAWEIFIHFNSSVGINSVEDLKNWIDDNSPIIVYAIRGGLGDNNPGAEINIRDSYPDLNNEWLDITENSMAYEGGTNISQENDDLPFDISANTLKLIS